MLPPAYTGAALIASPGGPISGPGSSPAAWTQLVCFALFVGNFAVIGQGVILHLLNPMWSLCIEEQFYIVWGLSMKMFKRNIYLIAALVACGLAAPITSGRTTQKIIWPITSIV